MGKGRKIGSIFWLIISTITILGFVWSVKDPLQFKSYQEISRIWFQRLSIFAPIVFVIIQAIQVVITPISHYTVGVIGGFLYGPIYGGLLNYFGRLLGHFISFTLSRKYGRKLLERYVNDSIIKKYDKIFTGSVTNDSKISIQSLILFFIYFLPFFPDDEISYLVGASKMPKRLFVLANIFGHLGGSFSLAYIGSGINTKDTLFWFLTLITLAGFPIIWILFRISSKREKKLSGK